MQWIIVLFVRYLVSLNVNTAEWKTQWDLYDDITSNMNVKTFNHYSNKWMKEPQKNVANQNNVNNVIEQQKKYWKNSTELRNFGVYKWTPKHVGFIILKVINAISVRNVWMCVQLSFIDNVDGKWKSCVENVSCRAIDKIKRNIQLWSQIKKHTKNRLELKTLSHWSHHIQI